MISFLFITTSLLIVATTLVVLRRMFYARGRRQRMELLGRLRYPNTQQQINNSSLKASAVKEEISPIIAGFLHPYCNAGGGGERVLFAAISYLQRNDPHVLSVVYAGDTHPTTGLPIPKDEILKRCKERFGIELEGDKVEFVHVKWRWLVEDATWKRFTLAGQGLGAALLAVEALWRLVPDVFLDTHGLAFSYPVAQFLTHGITTKTSSTTSPSRMPIIPYIHYPTISSSMLNRVSNRSATYANSTSITSSSWRSTAKLVYYRLFTFAYTLALQVVPPNFIAVNSSWTGRHVEALLGTSSAGGTLPGYLGVIVDLGTMLIGWSVPTPQGINQPPNQDEPSLARESTLPSPSRVRRIYPPCDVEPLRAFLLEGRKKIVFSCAQFRPEKDHAKQIQAFSILFKKHPGLFVPEPQPGTRMHNNSGLKDAAAAMDPATGVGIGPDMKEPVTIEESGWLPVDSSRPPSPSKTSGQPVISDTSTETAKDDETSGEETLKLVLLGSARHHEDLVRVEELRSLARELGIETHVEFRLNAPYSELLHWLSVSSIGISTMVEEHFGIGVVEFMGAGLIPLVHASGGPIMDIVTPVDRKPTGYLATSAEEFADQLYIALRMGDKEALEMRARARKSSARFSTVAFERGFGALWEDVKKNL